MEAQRPGTVRVKDMKEGHEVRGFFAVRSKELPRDYRNKAGRYFFLRIGDSSGDIPLKYWGGEDVERTMQVYNSFSVGSVLYVQGMAAFDKYDDVLTVVINEGRDELRVVEEDAIKDLDLVPSLGADRIKALTEELFELMASVSDSLRDAALSEIKILIPQQRDPVEKSRPLETLNSCGQFGILAEAPALLKCILPRALLPILVMQV